MLSFTKQKAFLSNVNLRGEKHGPDTKPAVDLAIDIESPNTLLEVLEPGMLGAFYVVDATQPQLIEAHPTSLRLKTIVPMVAWKKEYPGYSCAIGHGIDDDSALIFDDVTLGKFVVEMKDGGTVVLSCRVQVHPVDGQIDALALKIQQQIELTLTPPDGVGEQAPLL